MTPRTLPPLREYAAGGRLVPSWNGSNTSETENPVALLDGLAELLTSQDPMDRYDASRRVFLLTRAMTCPDGIWVVQSRYANRPGSSGLSGRTITWSAHLTREHAVEWHAAWVAKWRGRRDDYEFLPVHQADGISLQYLRHPDARAAYYVTKD